MTITAKFPGRCSCCGNAISPGAKIEWSKGSPARHLECASATPVAATRRSSRGRGRWTGCSCGSREDSYGGLIPSPRNCASCEHDA